MSAPVETALFDLARTAGFTMPAPVRPGLPDDVVALLTEAHRHLHAALRWDDIPDKLTADHVKAAFALLDAIYRQIPVGERVRLLAQAAAAP